MSTHKFTIPRQHPPNALRCLITCVGFSDFLALTLPYNRHHFVEVMVLTDLQDEATVEVALANRARVFRTNSFYHANAKFAKFRALEEALDHYGRHGLLCLLDTDIFWPKDLPPQTFHHHKIYSFARRRLLLDTTAPIPPESEWSKLPLDPQFSECLGFTQIFHADDPHLGIPPWHRIELTHGALGDSFFQAKWRPRDRIWLPYDVLHLGDYANNWLGRVVPHRDGSLPEQSSQLTAEVESLKQQLWPEGHPSQGEGRIIQ